MKRQLAVLSIVALLAIAGCSSGSSSSSSSSLVPSSQSSEKSSETSSEISSSKTSSETPEPSSSKTPEPSSSETPEPSSSETPEPSSSVTPEPSSSETPEPSSSSTTPEPSSSSTPEPVSSSTPEPVSSSTPEPISSSSQDPSSSGYTPTSQSIIVPELQRWDLPSPDSSLMLSLTLDYGKLSYEVKKNGTNVVNESSLSMVTEYNDMTALSFVKANIAKDDISLEYDNISGKCSHVSTSYRDSVITFGENEFFFDIYVRMFNDGYGFRYGIRAKDDSIGSFEWEDENTYFNLPSNSIAYALKYVPNTTPIEGSTDEYYSYEGTYGIYSYKQMSSNTYVYPFLYRVNDNLYSMLNEVDLVGSEYHGSMLTKRDEGLKIVHAKNSGTNPGKTISYPFISPWRMGTVGTLEEVFASNVHEDMLGQVEYWKPDNYDSLSDADKANYDYSWVTPGAGVWNYLIHRAEYQSNFEWQKQYVDLCVNLGWKWLILDAGWDVSQPGWKYSFNKMKEFTSYCHDRGIKVMCWANVFTTFNGRDQASLSLDTWKELGIDGIKIDFWDGQGEDSLSLKSKMESKETIEKYEIFYEEAAKRQMVVDCHGCNKPTSERRIFPNVINREAINGEENAHRSPSNNIFLSLVRTVTGPGDFTPATLPLDGFQTNLTTCNNMALAVQLESGIPTFSGEISDYWDVDNSKLTDVGKFYKDIPVAWDESKLLSYDLEDEMDVYCAVARRKADTWYIGGSSSNQRSETIDFSFLEEGEYTLEVWEDSDDKYAPTYKVESIEKGDLRDIAMKRNGGFVMKVSKK